MGSRPALVQHQNRGEAVAGDIIVKQKKNMAAAAGGGGGQGRNRRALGDIGNLVTVRGGGGVVDAKPSHISRPVTRSFCAQLLANAQAAAENNKKPVDKAAIGVDGAIAIASKRAVVVAQKKAAAHKKVVTVKPKPENVIEISPDTSEQQEEDVKKEKKPPLNPKKASEDGSSRKKTQTLTSILTARSKAACGLTDKPREEQILDIDAVDVNNELAVVEYVEDIYKFYKLVENESRVHDYMDSQPEINERMRAILVDWLIEVHNKFELMPETLYLTINIVDRYLSINTVSRRELQLVGMGAMLMASKYEEIWAPEVNDFVCISDRAYSHEQVLIMEKRILGGLEWNLTVPTPYVFLVRFIKASDPDQNMENMVYFLAELGMMNYTTIIYCPSMIAASAVYAARCTLNKTPLWNETLKRHTGFSEPQLRDCAKLLVSLHLMASENKLKVIHRKYSNPQRGAVALLPPAKTLLST
ncbi:G2/mitotic-specific cyclin S13-7-like [Cornus florida]|uniref:G2/mitotic-specific cyclin S13-7-like n=1 Tax=Cornus florida TaxID=4283 RepID=UPI002897AE26|nr:G2/mitotic-specific cyclin S13-7-like [Cornus florida]